LASHGFDGPRSPHEIQRVHPKSKTQYRVSNWAEHDQAEALTHGSADDAKTAVDFIDGVENGIASFTADAAYDTIVIHDAV
jgi:hypothetical protein